MIVSRKARFCYVAIPKTGSKSLRGFLARRPYRGRFIKPYHGNVFRRPSRDWCVWSVVRHPYARLLSWWWFTCRRSKLPKADREYWGDCSLAEFIRRITVSIKGKDLGDQPDMRRQQHVFLQRAGADRAVRLERFAEEFPALPFAEPDPPALPRVRLFSEKTSWQDGGRTWPDWYDQEALEAANAYGAAQEAEALGYRPCWSVEQMEPSTDPVGPIAMEGVR